MTFESMVDVPTNNGTPPATETPSTASPLEQALDVETSAEETLVVKALFGTDLRRANSVARYAPLHEVCCKLFVLDPASAVLKYQDEDGDKITMSSDDELKEACKLAKDKVLRVFVEIKQQAAPALPTPPPAQQQQQQQAELHPHAAPFYPGMNYAWHGGMRGGFGGRGGFGHHRGGGFGGRGFHHGFPHHAPHHAPPHYPPHMGGQLYPPLPPHVGHVQHSTPYEQSAQAGVTATYSSAHVSNHGVFSPAADVPPFSPSHCKGARAEASPYAHCWKERKHAIKQQVKFLKENCVTEEDRESLKQLKREMYKEVRSEKKALKDGEKCEKKKEKKDKKKEKKERKCNKDKKEKCEKKEKLMARHVADVTIPDNSELPADTPVTKTWRLRNAGSIAWPADSQLLFISRRGDDLNGPERVFVGAVEPQQEVEVSVTFVTPNEAGRYIGYYRMAAANGKFGQRVWVSFIIPPPAPSTPMPDASPSLAKPSVEEQAKEGEQPSAPLLDVNME